jgi:hypothetical protein
MNKFFIRIAAVVCIAALFMLAACGSPAGGPGGNPPIPLSGVIDPDTLNDLLELVTGGTAAIELRDSSGQTITSVPVTSDGTWTAELPPEYAGFAVTAALVVSGSGGPERVFDVGPISVNSGGNSEVNLVLPNTANTYAIAKGTETNGSVTLSRTTDVLEKEIITITATPDTGYYVKEVTITKSDGETVTRSPAGSNKWTFSVPAGDVTVTVEFAGLTVVTATDLSSLITAPVKGAAPDTTSINENQYTGTIAWQTQSGTPHSGAFAASTVYRAVVMLIAKTGYTFNGVAADSFTYTGATSVTNAANSGTVTITFPATAADGEPDPDPDDEPNTEITIEYPMPEDPSVLFYLDGNSTALLHNGTTTIPTGSGIFTVNIASGSYSEIIWYLNGNPQTQAQGKTSIILSKQTAATWLVTVEATPVDGEKNSGAHTFVVQ